MINKTTLLKMLYERKELSAQTHDEFFKLKGTEAALESSYYQGQEHAYQHAIDLVNIVLKEESND